MKRRMYLFVCSLLLLTILYSSFMAYREYNDNHISEIRFSILSQAINNSQEANSIYNKDEAFTLTSYEKYRQLHEKNADFIGWLSIENTSINYPVMQTKDNPNFYLRKNFDKQYSDFGVPFVSEDCDVNISDNTIIYGHHISGQRMFGALEQYANKDFYSEHTSIHFDTLEGYGKYEILAVFKTTAYSPDGFKYYQFTNASNQDQFDQYIVTCNALAFYDTGIDAKYGDKLITLSTCEYSQKDGRFVIVAKKIIQDV